MAQETLEVRQHNLLFGIRRSVLYHARRRRFFENLSRFVKVLTALSGVGTITTVLGAMGENWTIGFAAAVAILSTIDLVVGLAERGRLHWDLSKRFIELEKEMVNLGTSISEIQLADI
jgi:hypothetical protein